MMSRGKVTLVLLLFALTWFALQSSSEVVIVPIYKSLNKIPQKIGNFHLSNSSQSSSEVLELLGVDDYIQYNYVDRERNRINLYAGFYGAVGVTGSYHSPKNCLPGGGWGIESVEIINLKTPLASGKHATVSEMIIRNGSDYQVVLYWYQNRGRIIASEYWEKVYLVIDAIFQGRRDGTFVRIMTVAREGEVTEAKKRSRDFAEKVMDILTEHLPGRDL